MYRIAHLSVHYHFIFNSHCRAKDRKLFFVCFSGRHSEVSVLYKCRGKRTIMADLSWKQMVFLVRVKSSQKDFLYSVAVSLHVAVSSCNCSPFTTHCLRCMQCKGETTTSVLVYIILHIYCFLLHRVSWTLQTVLLQS